MSPTAVIIDTDIGGDPDDAIALVLAARRLPELALVVTCDELGGERARFARHLLDLLGRGDVPVVAGADVTFTDERAIDENAPLYRALAAEHAAPWAVLLRTHLDRWFARFDPATIQHDPLTPAAAMRLPYVEFRRAPVALDGQARMRGVLAGIPIQMSSGARYAALLSWLADQLTGRAPTGPSGPDQTGSDAASSAGW
jgi:hypothetical protein